MEIATVEGFLRYHARIRARTDRLVPLIPAEQIEWRPHAGRFSFGDLLRHLAGLERYMWAENVHGRPSRYPGHAPDLAPGYDATLAYYHRLRDEAQALFATLTDAGLQRPAETPAGRPLATWKWLRAMVEHEVHHRGQIYLMLGMCEIRVPQLFGLTAEEVQARSQGSHEVNK